MELSGTVERVRAKCFINEILAEKCLFRIPEFLNFNLLTFHSQSSKNVVHLVAEKLYNLPTRTIHVLTIYSVYSTLLLILV